MKKKEFRFYWEEEPKRSGGGINIELPGFGRDEIRVSVDGGFVNISAEKREKKKEEGKGFYKEEAFERSFRRSMSLPAGVDPKDLDIKIEEGSVRIKRKKAKPQ